MVVVMNLNRSELRKKIMTILYQVNVYETNNVEYTIDDVIKQLVPIDNEFVKEIVYGVVTYKNELRDIANKYLNGWTIDRLGNTDQAILLMALYELKYAKTPPIVVINEALNLADIYSDIKVKNMINAVLDKFYHNEVLNEG